MFILSVLRSPGVRTHDERSHFTLYWCPTHIPRRTNALREQAERRTATREVCVHPRVSAHRFGLASSILNNCTQKETHSSTQPARSRARGGFVHHTEVFWAPHGAPQRLAPPRAFSLLGRTTPSRRISDTVPHVGSAPPCFPSCVIVPADRRLQGRHGLDQEAGGGSAGGRAPRRKVWCRTFVFDRSSWHILGRCRMEERSMSGVHAIALK